MRENKVALAPIKLNVHFKPNFTHESHYKFKKPALAVPNNNHRLNNDQCLNNDDERSQSVSLIRESMKNKAHTTNDASS